MNWSKSQKWDALKAIKAGSRNNFNNAKIKKIREDFNELRDRFLKPKIKEIREIFTK